MCSLWWRHTRVALDTAGMSYFPGKGFYTKDIRRKFVWKKEARYKITFFKNKGWVEKIMFVDFMYVENFFLHICVSFGQTMKYAFWYIWFHVVMVKLPLLNWRRWSSRLLFSPCDSISRVWGTCLCVPECVNGRLPFMCSYWMHCTLFLIFKRSQ